jgi:hypothetical protein
MLQVLQCKPLFNQGALVVAPPALHIFLLVNDIRLLQIKGTTPLVYVLHV